MKMNITLSTRDTDMGLHGIDVRSREFSNKTLKVGYPEGGKVAKPTQEGSNHEPFTTMEEVASVALIHEHGSDSQHIPARPTLGPALENNKQEIIDKVKELDGKLIDGSATAEQVYKEIGELMVGMVKQQIIVKTEPKLRPSTVARKGFDKPLMDRLQMLETVQYKVVKK
jgi:phage gpG-like protein